MNIKPEDTQAAIDQARRWRVENGYAGRGGVVVLFDGQVQGWVDRLRDPGHWRPGCIAIDEVGHCWHSQGGNVQDGAAIWAPVTIDDIHNYD